MARRRRDRERELERRLQEHELLRQRGYTFRAGDGGGVVVERWDSFVGIWSHVDGHFQWTPGGHQEPTDRTRSVVDAVRHTLVIIAKA